MKCRRRHRLLLQQPQQQRRRCRRATSHSCFISPGFIAVMYAMSERRIGSKTESERGVSSRVSILDVRAGREGCAEGLQRNVNMTTSLYTQRTVHSVIICTCAFAFAHPRNFSALASGRARLPHTAFMRGLCNVRASILYALHNDANPHVCIYTIYTCYIDIYVYYTLHTGAHNTCKH